MSHPAMDALLDELRKLAGAVNQHIGEVESFDPLRTIAEARSIIENILADQAPRPDRLLATFSGRIVEVGEIKLGDELGHRASLVIACDTTAEARAAGTVLYTDCTFEARFRR